MNDVSEVLADRVVVGEPLGTGGAGSVHLAHDRVLDRRVAIKRLLPTQDEPARARLREEARLAGALHHPGIAGVYDYGEDAAGTPYVVMQYVDGVPLRRLLVEQGRLPADRVRDLVAQVADALHAAHLAGIVHRDVKPGNILVEPDGRAVLVDFGIARGADGEPLTTTGTIVGTVDYISPEQAGGHSASPRSDVYSLGMVAYECLTGERPLRRENQIATLVAHLHEDVPPLGDDVPADLRELVHRMVARDPACRPVDAAEVSALARGVIPPSTFDALVPGSDDPARARPPAGVALLHPDETQVIGHVPVTSLVTTRGGGARRAQGRGRHGARRERPSRLGVVLGTTVGLLALLGVLALWAASATSGQRSPEASDASASPSAEPAVARVRVPVGLVGLSYRDAARRLVAVGLVPDRVEGPAGTMEPGHVLRVDPLGRVDRGSVVKLVVAGEQALVQPTSPQTSGTGSTGGSRASGSTSGGGSTGGSTGGTVGPGKGGSKAHQSSGKAKGKH